MDSFKRVESKTPNADYVLTWDTETSEINIIRRSYNEQVISIPESTFKDLLDKMGIGDNT